MDALIIKMKQKYYPKDDDIRKLLRYIAGKGKNASREKAIYVKGKGLSADYCKATKQIMAMQKYLGKNNKRRCYQMIVSFPACMEDKNVLIIIAEEIAEKIFEEFQVYYGVHKDTENLHIHFAINAVSYRSGKKWHTKIGELEDFKKVLLKATNDILVNNGCKKLRLSKN